MQRSVFVVLIALSAASRLFPAAACIGGNNLATYQALGATGCMIGGLLVNDFTFSVVSAGGGAVPIASTTITVTPTAGPGFLGIMFSSSGFSVTGGEFVNYLIGYTWDPTGDIRGLGDVLDPGLADIVTDGCVGAAFSGSLCSGTPVSVHVFQGATSQLTDATFFSPTGILGIRNNISLNANGGSASFKGIENDAYIPEPSSSLLAGVGLAILAIATGKGRKRPLAGRAGVDAYPT